MARRAGISQSFESAIERGVALPTLEVLSALAFAGGGRLVVRVAPGDGISLRDSGQLEIVQLIASECHPRWRRTIEMPIGIGPDRRAADLVIETHEEVVLIEVQRVWVDHQGQYRPLQLKRAALAERLGRPVSLVLALIDTERTRRTLVGHQSVLRETLPVSSRRIWAAIRSGERIGGDGILWIRPSALRARGSAADRPERSQPARRSAPATS